jgi:hypothetical protein
LSGVVRQRYDPAVRLLVLGVACALLASGAALAGPPSGTFAGCPHGALPLPGPASAYAAATRTVVLRLVHAHPSHAKTAGATTDFVQLVRQWQPSGWIKSECGLRVWNRSLVVGVYYPAMDPPHNPVGRCNDCARIRFILSKTQRGWLVWGFY